MHKFLKYFEIPVTGLKQGIHSFDFEVKREFFTHFDFDEFEDAQITARLDVDKSSTMMVMTFTFGGFINVPCDLCGDVFNLQIDNEFRLIGKFSHQQGDDNDEIIHIPYDESRLNIAQYLYEFILLATPAKRVHKTNECNPEALAKLKEFIVDSPTKKLDEDEMAEEEDNKTVWELLKKLKNDN
ncbi:MAG: YceD family protein [Flavobacteriales bacterium]